MSEREYESVQTRKPVFIWVIILGVAGMGWWGFIQQVIGGRPFGNNPAPDFVVVALWVVLSFALPLFIHLLRLTIRVDGEGVLILYRPIWKKRIALDEIATAAPVTYNPILDWGGWGIRARIGGGWAYTLSGNRGVRLTLRDGRERLLGTDDPDGLALAILERIEAAGGED